MNVCHDEMACVAVVNIGINAIKHGAEGARGKIVDCAGPTPEVFRIDQVERVGNSFANCQVGRDDESASSGNSERKSGNDASFSAADRNLYNDGLV